MNPKIDIGNKNGKWFSQDKWDHVMMPLAERLLKSLPLENVYIHYEPIEDYIHLEFDLEDDHYDIQYYKVFRIRKNRVKDLEKSKLFGRDTNDVEIFFNGGLYKNWVV